MRNSEKYYQAARKFATKSAEIEGDYQESIAALAAFQGSEYGEAKSKEAASKKAADLEALRRECYSAMCEAVENMRTTYAARTLTAPTAEQVQILTVLRMIKPDQATLQAAANTMQGCGLALRALDAISEGKTRFCKEPSSDEVEKHCKSLLNSAARIVQGKRAQHFDDITQCFVDNGGFGYYQDDSGTIRPNTAGATAFCECVDGEAANDPQRD